MFDRFKSRRGQSNPALLIGLGVAGVLIVGIIIGVAIHNRNKEKARTSSQAHLAACKELQVQISQQKSPLASVGLQFQPYQARFDASVRKQKQAEAVIDRDPHQADKLAGEAEGDFKSLLFDLQLAVQVKTDRSASTALAEAEEAVGSVRAREVEWNYPGSSSGRSERYRLDEQGFNPDTHLGAARRLLGSIDSVLDAGNPQEASRILHESKSESAAARRCIDTVMDSKKRVEAQMSAVQQSCESADSRYEAEVHEAYFGQQFVGAARSMDALKKLIEDRKETRELLAFCQRLARDVERSVEENRDYTSTATDQKLSVQKDQLQRLADAVKQSNANWSELKSTAQKVEKTLNEVKSEAGQSRKDYEDAVFAVRSFRRDYEQCDRDGTPPLTFFFQATHPDITDPVKEKAKDVNTLITRVERQVKLTKQDWRQVKSDAEAGSKLLSDLKQMVEEDNKKLEDLVAAKELLRKVTSSSRYACTVNGVTYNAGDSNRRDGDFNSHGDNAGDRYDVALRAWKARERVGFEDALRTLKQEVKTLNNIGWYNMLRMMRTSSDPVAQRIAWENGFRDDKSRLEWEDGFVKKRATGPGGLWEPDTKTGSGAGADFGPPPDFKAPLPN